MISFELIKLDGPSPMIKLPEEWVESKGPEFALILGEVGLIVPSYIMEATGEALALSLLESLIEAGIIKVDDAQKAVEHLV